MPSWLLAVALAASLVSAVVEDARADDDPPAEKNDPPPEEPVDPDAVLKLLAHT